MAFAQVTQSNGTTNIKHSMGDLMLTTGSYTNAGGGTGGSVTTGLNTVLFFSAVNNAASTADQPSVNTTIPNVTNGSVTIVCASGVAGNWIALGTI